MVGTLIYLGVDEVTRRRALAKKRQEERCASGDHEYMIAGDVCVFCGRKMEPGEMDALIAKTKADFNAEFDPNTGLRRRR